MTKRKCKNPKFDVIVCCQGQPFHYYCSTLIGGLVEYGYQYLKKRKYETMNISLKQVFGHLVAIDDIAKEEE